MFLKYEEFNSLNEALITFGGRAYPKFGNIIALAGGAGSGKGFILKNLVGMEGKVMDVDAIKELAQSAKGIIAKVKEEFGIDISKETFSMKNPENVSKLHVLLSDKLKIVDKNKIAFFASVLTAAKDRKPNIIFDVTMKNMKKFKEICADAEMLGYDPKCLHVVWVINDVEVAKKQNKERSRTVPEEILMDTHIGAQQTMFDLLNDSKNLVNGVLDGDIVFAFNKAKIDADLEKSDSGGMYIKKANYIYVKRAGKPPLSPDQLGKVWLEKIASYTPNSKSWKDVMDKLNESIGTDTPHPEDHLVEDEDSDMKE